MRKTVYVMAPFRAKTEIQRQENIRRAELVGVELARAGFAPLVPHKTVAYYYDELPESEMMDICLSLLAGCHMAYCVATSDGVFTELAHAGTLNIPVFRNMEAIRAEQKI